MKESRFTESQIMAILKQYEAAYQSRNLPVSTTSALPLSTNGVLSTAAWMHQFESVEHAQLLATQWLWKYNKHNNERPSTAIGGVPPRWLLKAA